MYNSVVDCKDIAGKTWLYAPPYGAVHSSRNYCQNLVTDTVKYPLSPGAGQTKDATFKEWRIMCGKFFNRNYGNMIKQERVLLFPPGYFHHSDALSKTISSWFVECLKLDKFYGLVALGYDANKHLDIVEYDKEDLAPVHLQLAKTCEDRILVYSPVFNLVLNVRVTEGTDLKAVQSAEMKCNEDLKAFAIIYGSVLKDHGLVLFSITAAPNISSTDDEQRKILPFLYGEGSSFNLLLTERELLNEKTLKSWWENVLRKEMQKLFDCDSDLQQSEKEKSELFCQISSEVIASMSAVSTSLPSLCGGIHEQLSTLLLNEKQVEAINDPSKKKILKGGYGTGKSIVGKEIVRSICNTNKSRTLVYYICFDPCSLLDNHMKDVSDDLKKSFLEEEVTSVVDVVCYSIIAHCSISDLLTRLCAENQNDYDEVHFVVEEIDGESITSKEADFLNELFKHHSILVNSTVVLIIQSLEKSRSLNVNGQNPKPHKTNCFDILERSSMKIFLLGDTMRTTLEIYEVQVAAQQYIKSLPNIYNLNNQEMTRIVSTKSILDIGNMGVKDSQQLVGTKIIDSEDTERILETGNVDLEQNVISSIIVSEDTEQILETENVDSEDMERILDTDRLAQSSNAAEKVGSSSATFTTFDYCREFQAGHSITNIKPNLMFLMETYSEEKILHLSKILGVFLKYKLYPNSMGCPSTRVVICNDIDGCILLENAFSMIKFKLVIYTPWLFEKLPTRRERDEKMAEWKKGKNCVLLTDSRGFRGMEDKEVLILCNRNEYYHKQSLPETICRATTQLHLVIFDKPNIGFDDTIPTLKPLFDSKLNELVETIWIDTEEDPGNDDPIREEPNTIEDNGKSVTRYYINLKSAAFNEESEELKQSEYYDMVQKEKRLAKDRKSEDEECLKR